MSVFVDTETATTPPPSIDLLAARFGQTPGEVIWGIAPSNGTTSLGNQPPLPAQPSQRDHLAELTLGAGATARIVLHLAGDLDVTFAQLAYTALWAPRVADDMAYRDSQLAFLSRDTLTAATGLDGQKAMRPDGVVATSVATVGLVRMVTRGTPGAISREDGKGWRGEATSWTLTAPPDQFVHRVRRLAPTGTAVPDRTPLAAEELDRGALNAWTDPRFPWWRSDAAGPTGLRLLAILLTRFGVTDVLLRTADVVAMTGVHRQTAWQSLRGLTRLGLACKEGRRGHWRVRIASHLIALTGDDLKYLTARPPRPSLSRATTHDWGWFDPDGRAMRQRARSVLTDVPDVTQEVVTPGVTRIDRRTGWARGAVMGTVEMLRYADGMGHKAARRALGWLWRPEPDPFGPPEPAPPVWAPAGLWGPSPEAPTPRRIPKPRPATAKGFFDHLPNVVIKTSGENPLERLRQEQLAEARAAMARGAQSRPAVPAPQRPPQAPSVAVPGFDLPANATEEQVAFVRQVSAFFGPPPVNPVAE